MSGGVVCNVVVYKIYVYRFFIKKFFPMSNQSFGKVLATAEGLWLLLCPGVSWIPCLPLCRVACGLTNQRKEEFSVELDMEFWKHW